MRITILLFSLTFLFSCTSTKNQTDSSQNQTDANNTTVEKTITEKTEEIPKSNIDFSSLKEGWIGDTKARAIVSVDTSEMLTADAEKLVARERLVWLMLLDEYSLTREDKDIATRLAASNTFLQLGGEEFHEVSENGTKRILIEKDSEDLRMQWNAFLPRLEKKYPELMSKRK